MALGAYVYGLNPLATGVPSVVMIDIDPWQSRISLFEAPTRTTCFFFVSSWKLARLDSARAILLTVYL